MSNTITREQGNFSTIPNKLLNDPMISLTAKGLYAFMRGKPPLWNFTIRSMAKQLKEGETAIGNALNELKDSDWVRYIKKSDGKGVYHLLWSPSQEYENKEYESPDLENPNQENPNQGYPMKGKPQRISNKEPIVRKNNNNKDATAHSAKAEIVGGIFNFWCETMGKNPNSSKLTPKRDKAIKQRLDDGYTVDDIKTAILGCSQDKFSMGENDRKKQFNDIELICRTGEKLESFRDSYRPIKQQKQTNTQAVQPTKLNSLSAEEQEKERQAAQALIDQLGDL